MRDAGGLQSLCNDLVGVGHLSRIGQGIFGANDLQRARQGGLQCLAAHGQAGCTRVFNHLLTLYFPTLEAVQYVFCLLNPQADGLRLQQPVHHGHIQVDLAYRMARILKHVGHQ